MGSSKAAGDRCIVAVAAATAILWFGHATTCFAAQAEVPITQPVIVTDSGPATTQSLTTNESLTTTRSEKPLDLFHDPEDGAFDVSGFLDTRAGFLPIAIPITEPAVGYGLGGGLTFFHTRPQALQTASGPRVLPPNVTAVFGMGTENGSWATGAAHLHTWENGKVRYLVGGGYADLNLDWFGQSDALSGHALSYELKAFALVQKLTFKLGDSDFFMGPTQRFLTTRSQFDDSGDRPPNVPDLGIGAGELDSTVSGLGLTLGYDTRNSLFSPTRGTKASLSYTQNGESIGSDFDYGRLDAEVIQYLPLAEKWALGMRGKVTWVGDDAPFFDLGSIRLRGIQVGRYVDNVALTGEAELRWDLARRWTLVGFAGVGAVADAFSKLDESQGRWAGGTGFRYLLARKYDMRLGCDVARGPEDWAFYVTIGTGWLRD